MITLQRKGTLGRTNQILSESSHVSHLNLLNLTILLGVIILQFFLYDPSKKQTKNVLDNVIEKSKQCREIVTSLPPQKK